MAHFHHVHRLSMIKKIHRYDQEIFNTMLSKVCTKSRKFSSEMPNFPTQRGSAPWIPALVTNFTTPRGEAILDPPVSREKRNIGKKAKIGKFLSLRPF